MGKGKKTKTKQKEKKNLGRECDSEYIKYSSPGERITLEDSGTKLFIKAKCNMRCLQVDHGILPDLGYKVNKCDFLCENLDDRQIHLIEMKHELLDDSYKQLAGTPEAVKMYTEYGDIFERVARLDAYIVSPGAQKITNANNSTDCTNLCKILASYCKTRPDNIYDLLKYVKVVKKNAGTPDDKQRILCSNDNPLVL